MIHPAAGVREAFILSILIAKSRNLAASSVYDKKMLSRINTLLLVLIIVINSFIALAPLWPAASYELNKSNKQRVLNSKITATNTSGPNRIIAPGMQLEAEILESPAKQAYSTLDKGIWRLNKGSTPDKGGNTVLIGHRFTYTNPRGVFYHLDKLKQGDTLAVIWDQQKYLYTVRDIDTVKASQVEIEAPTNNSQLTLYTCTPLWLPKDRLVVVADLEENP